MNIRILYIIVITAVVIFIGGVAILVVESFAKSKDEYNKEQAYDNTYLREFPTREHIDTIKYEYGIIIDQDTLWLYDGNRLVGRIDYTKQKLDSLIFKDNE